MHPNAKLVEYFYTSFQNLDGDKMMECYHEDIQFSDPVFPLLEGAAAGSMWKMLCVQARGFELSFSDIQADDSKGRAHWEAKYDFSLSGKRVHNIIDAVFEFRDGKIIRHTDSFGFWKWSAMALGPIGMFLGWTPLLRNKVRQQAANNLSKFIESKH